MKHLATLVFLCVVYASPGSGRTHTITNSGFTFSPSTLTIASGDTVIFSIASIHNAVEVSQATWNANGNTPLAGGFSLGFGGGQVIPNQPGTHFYVCQPHASMGMKGTITVTPVTGVHRDGEEHPNEFILDQNYPNPFNPVTSVRYQIPVESRVTVTVHNLLGQVVATLLDGIQSPGDQSVVWDAKDMASGMYFLRMEAKSVAQPVGTFTYVRKMALTK